MTGIFKVKIGLPPESELINDIFKFNEKPYSLKIDLQFKAEDPNDGDGATIKLLYRVDVLLRWPDSQPSFPYLAG